MQPCPEQKAVKARVRIHGVQRSKPTDLTQWKCAIDSFRTSGHGVGVNTKEKGGLLSRVARPKLRICKLENDGLCCLMELNHFLICRIRAKATDSSTSASPNSHTRFGGS